MINAHTHIFTVQDVPVDFLRVGSSISPKIARMLVRMLQGNAIQKGLAMLLIGTKEEGKKYKAFVRIGIHKDMQQVFNVLREDNDYPDGAKFVALPMQFEWMGAGSCEKHSYEDQITELILAKKDNSEILFPFYAIDPRMGTTAKEVLTYVQKHLTLALPISKDAKGIDIFSRAFYGIKLYPSLGFFPYDPLLKDTYEYAEKNELPLMTHTSRGGICYVGPRKNIAKIYKPETMHVIAPCLLNYNSADPAKPIYKEPKYEYPDIDNDKVSNDDFCDYFLDPENYMDALALFPKLKICFAHFGSDSEIVTKLNLDTVEGSHPAPGSPRDDTWYDKVVSLLKIKEYPNLYTDISYTLHIPEFRKLVKDEVENDLKSNGTSNLNERLISKILFGTDFFMTYRERNSTEKKLVNESKKEFLDINPVNYPNLHALGINTLWEYMTVINPKKYLTSKFATF